MASRARISLAVVGFAFIAALSAPAMAATRVGETAPDFTLPSTSGEQVTLSSFRGKQHVLLAFFPLAFTSVCTAELCSFSDDFDAFAGKDVVVFPVSVDAIPSLKVFRSMHQMTVHLLSDFKREVIGPWDLLLDDKFFSKRAYVLIDKAGIVRWSFIEAHNGNKRENAELLQQIAALG
jgi:peroxiredoxin